MAEDKRIIVIPITSCQLGIIMLALFFCFVDIISDPLYERPEQSELPRQYSQQTFIQL